MVDFRAIIDNLVDIGFYSVFLPFMLVYVIVFAILEKSNLFKGGSSDGKQAKNVNAVIAFVFGLFTVASIQTVMYIESLIVNIVVFIIFFLCLLILLGFVFGEKYTEIFENKYVKWGVVIAIILVVLSILLRIIGFWDWFLDLEFADSETVTNVLVFLGIAGVLYWITKSDSKKD